MERDPIVMRAIEMARSEFTDIQWLEDHRQRVTRIYQIVRQLDLEKECQKTASEAATDM